MPGLAPSPPSPAVSRSALIAGGVVLLHVGGIWALHTGLLRRAVEIVVPVEILSQIIEPPKPLKIEPPPPPPPPPPQPQPRVRREPTLPPPPQPVAIQDPTPAPAAPTGVVTPQPPPPPIAAPVAPAPAPPAPPPAPPAPPRIVLPSSDAAYLSNPRPAYPRMSKMMGEQGRVVLAVLIGADGRPKRAKIVQSSGFARLDEAAHETVMGWRYVPGKRNGVAEEMEFDVPINWQLDR